MATKRGWKEADVLYKRFVFDLVLVEDLKRIAPEFDIAEYEGHGVLSYRAEQEAQAMEAMLVAVGRAWAGAKTDSSGEGAEKF